MAVLPCGHALCSACLEGCIEGNGQSRCSMDRTPFELDVDVCWISAPHDHTAKLQVSCWNAQHGCDFEGPLGELLEHFEKECDFHETSCPRCANSVLCQDMPTHYRATCFGNILPRRKGQSGTATNVAGGMQKPDTVACSHDGILTSIQSKVKEIAETLDGISTRLVAHTQESNVPDMTSIQSRVDEIEEMLDGLSTRLAAYSNESDALSTENGPKAKDLDVLLAAFNETNAALTEGFSSLKQSLPLEVVSALPRSLEDGLTTRQRALAPTSGEAIVGGSLPSDALSSCTKIDATIMFAVVSIVLDDWREHDGHLTDLQFVKDITVYIGKHRTGVDITCLVYREANFIAVYSTGKSVKPVEWELLTVRPLNPSDLTSPSLKDFCVLYAETQPENFSWSQQDRVLRYLSFLKTPLGEDKTKLDFVLEFKRRPAATRYCFPSNRGVAFR